MILRLDRGPRVPQQFDFDSTHGIVRGRIEGRVTDADLRNMYRKAAAMYAKLGAKMSGAITDFSAVTAFEVSAQTVLEMANLDPALPDQKKIRVIIAPKPVIFGMARMFEMFGERTRPNLHVVRTEQEAWAILGVWNPKFQPFEE